MHSPSADLVPSLEDVRRAAERLGGRAHRTPVLRSRSLDELSGAVLYFKCENMQRVGAFKFRGATNAVQSLTEKEAARGVATHSSGNHAAALALAARERGIPAWVVMPTTAPEVKQRAVRAFGATVVGCEPTLASREAALEEVVQRTGAHVVHPYNDARVIAGQGTAALELLEDVGDLDAIVTPVGGGGLISGTSVAAKGLRPSLRIIGVEPEAADDARRSLEAGRILPSHDPKTICDGLRTSLGTLTFAIIQRYVERILAVADDATIAAMRLLFERLKIVVEPSAAVTLAAVLEHKALFRGLRVGLVLSGGNVDVTRLPFRA